MRIPAPLRLLLLACLLVFSVERSGTAKPTKILDIADTVGQNRILTRFAAIIQSSDLGTFLSSKGPFTLFVPTDAAFAKLPPDMVEALLRPENKVRLQHILLFHLVNGKRFSAKDLLAQTTLLSCEGLPLTIKKSRSGVQYVLKARIVNGDIRCQNGVIHEIDSLLLPPEASLPPLVPLPPPGTPNTNAPAAAPGINASTTPNPSISAGTNVSSFVPTPPATSLNH
jgi:uncharacterized surface protein with fasciclin (FAS1) repeats